MEMMLGEIRARCQVTPELEGRLKSAFERVEFQAGDYIADGNSIMRHLYFLESGTIRTYFYHDGRDISSWFYMENTFFTSWYSFLHQEEDSEAIEVLKDCVVYGISKTALDELYDSFPEFNAFGRKLYEEQVGFLDYYFKAHSFISAKEKYDLLLLVYPDITQRVKLGHIASFLGISQETLSRIRGKK